MKPTGSHPLHGFATRHMAVVLTVSTGLFVTAFVFAQLLTLEHRALKEAFLHQANQRANAWIAAIEDRLSALDSLYALYGSSQYVDRDEFHSFVERSVLRYEGVKAVQWVPRVSAQTRYEHEQQARRDGIERYQIVGSLRDSPHESEPTTWFPIYYIEPLWDNLQILGFDLGSDPAWQGLLDRAAAGGTMTVTTRTHVPGDPPNTGTFSVIQPMYRRNNPTLTEAGRRENLEGFIIGVLDLGAMAKSAMASLTPAGIDIDLLDVTAAEPRCLYNHATRRRPLQPPSAEGPPRRIPLIWEKPLRLGGEPWVIRCSAAQGFGGNWHALGSLASLAIGLAATGLAASYVRGHQRRYRRVQRLVAERTRDLEASRAELKSRNEFLHHILASLAHPLYVIDAKDFTIKLSNQSTDIASPPVDRPTCHKVIYEKDRPCDGQSHVCPVIEVKNTKKPAIFERQGSELEGRSRVFEVSAYPVLDAEGNVTEVIEYHLDVTERKHAEQARREYTEELSAIYENAPVIMMLVDGQRRVRKINKMGVELAGASAESILGLRGGEALRCLHSLDDPEGCGFGPFCQECAVRRTVVDTLETGRSHGMVEVDLPFSLDGRTEELTFLLSSTRVHIQEQPMVLVSILDITARKKAEAHLEEELRFVETLLNTIPNPVFYKGIDGRYLGCNPAFEEFVGMPASQIIGKTVFDLGSEGIARRYHDQDRDLLAHPGKQRYEWEVQHARGQMRHVMFDKATFTDASGHVCGLIGVMSDITERRIIEDQMKDLARFPAENPNPILRARSDGMILYANRVAGSLLESLGTHVGERLPEKWARPVVAAFQSMDVTTEELVCGPCVLSVTFAPVCERDYVNLYIMDITQRKQAAEELRARKDLLSHILANIPAFVFWKDRNSTYLGCNEAFASSAGVGCPENIVGKTDYDLVWKDDAEAYRQDDRRVMDSGKPRLAFEETQTTKEGGQITLLTSKVPLRDTSGAVVGILGVYADITERKLAEKRQAALLEELESVNCELKDFAHIVSHDLKAPLRGIHTLAEWMMTDLGDRLGEEGREQMQLLMGRTDRMQNLINGVLEYSRIGRVHEERASINLNELVAQVVEDLLPPEHISLDIDGQLPTVSGEPTRIRQLFQNLLSNAIKYMDKEHGLIRVGCEEEPDSWRFFVADNGPGIEEKYFDRIFQIFQTLAPRDTTESTGVGLTVVKKIVECHGGRIWIESRMGEGSTFFFTLSKPRMEAIDADRQAAVAC